MKIDDARTRPSHRSACATLRSALRFDDIPPAVVRRAEDLLLDWVGSALAGKGARAGRDDRALRARDGAGRRGQRSADLAAAARRRCSPRWSTPRRRTSPSRTTCTTARCSIPAAVVFPPALAVAQALGCAGRELLTAAVAGYEVGIRVGEFLGRSHYKVFHTTGTAGTLAAAAAAGRLLRLSPPQMQHAFGSAGTQAAGLWEFLRDAADSKQLHTAQGGRRWPDRGLPRARRIHRARRASSKARRAWRRACRATPIPRGSPTASASAGRWPRPRSSSTPRAATRIRPPTRCCRSSQSTSSRRTTSRRSPRMCTRRRSTCWGRWSIRRRCTRPSSRWARCSG